MKTLADANNKFYRDYRDLGAGAKPSEVAALQNRVFAPGLKELEQEHTQKFKGWKNAIKANMITKEEFLKIFGYAMGSKGPGDAAVKKKVEEPVKAVGRVGAETGTGTQGGADGAKDANYGGKRKEVAPPVNADGIGTY
ncbi:MAG: hypothetical protein HY074_13350 [Deltaproteobacteria bacterium]|nr:hypothetical protein [Deltaproteobacteria bacterium]